MLRIINKLLKKCEKQGEQKPDRSENDNSFYKENCKGYQETGRYFADGDCKDKREAEHPSKKG